MDAPGGVSALHAYHEFCWSAVQNQALVLSPKECAWSLPIDHL